MIATVVMFLYIGCHPPSDCMYRTDDVDAAAAAADDDVFVDCTAQVASVMRIVLTAETGIAGVKDQTCARSVSELADCHILRGC